MKITKSQLKEIIREEISKLKKPLRESAKKGDVVSFTQRMPKGGNVKWFMQYVDSSHIKLNDDPKLGVGSAVYHMKELEKKPFYDDMVKWMNSGNKKFIDGKKY